MTGYLADGAEPAQPADLAARLRHLAGLLTTHELTERQRAEVDDLLASAAAVIDGGPALADPAGPVGPSTFARAFQAGAARLPSHPLVAGASGVYPPFAFAIDPDGSRLVATGSFHAAWEGPPGLVHGGFLAAGLDMALSTLANRNVSRAVTRTLTLRYLRPVPLASAVRIEVGRGAVEGRLLDLTGTLFADDRVALRATAQFATMTAERFGRAADPA